MYSDTYCKFNELVLYRNDTLAANLTIVHSIIFI